MNNNPVTTILHGNDRRGVIHTAERFHSLVTDSRKPGERAPSSTPQAVLCKSNHQLSLGPIKPSRNSARSARCLRCGDKSCKTGTAKKRKLRGNSNNNAYFGKNLLWGSRWKPGSGMWSCCGGTVEIHPENQSLPRRV